MQPGPTNLITDIEGLRVGNAQSEIIATGATVLLCDRPCTASASVLGGAPGTRDIALLEPDQTVQTIDAVALSGGSAFGLDTASGVQAGLAESGRGFEVGGFHVPIVPGAILFDLVNGGDKNWGTASPYPTLGRDALDHAAITFELGRAGAGYGATTGRGWGGLGSTSTSLSGGGTLGALVAVNALGSPYLGSSNQFWAAPFELAGEFGARGFDLNNAYPFNPRMKGAGAIENTTIGIIATDLALSKAQCKRLAIMAHGGYARALWPSHTPFDGDIIFAVSTGAKAVPDLDTAMMELSIAAPATMARAVARGVYCAEDAE